MSDLCKRLEEAAPKLRQGCGALEHGADERRERPRKDRKRSHRRSEARTLVRRSEMSDDERLRLTYLLFGNDEPDTKRDKMILSQTVARAAAEIAAITTESQISLAINQEIRAPSLPEREPGEQMVLAEAEFWRKDDGIDSDIRRDALRNAAAAIRARKP